MAKTSFSGARHRLKARAAAAATHTTGGKSDGDGGRHSEHSEHATPSSGNDGPLPAAHVSRKLDRKLSFLKKVASSSKIAKKSSAQARGRHSALNDYAVDLLAQLEGADGGDQSTSRKMQARKLASPVRRSASRQALCRDERARMAAVAAHPAYIADPLGAIAQHLVATTTEPPLPPSSAAMKPNKLHKKSKMSKTTTRNKR